jgi:uncharacterized SAM-binding protein YcdF (DUF218 family)
LFLFESMEEILFLSDLRVIVFVIELKLMIILLTAIIPAISVIFLDDLLLDDLSSDCIGLYVFEGKHSCSFTVIDAIVVGELASMVVFEIDLLIKVERLLYLLLYYFVLAFSQQIFHI